MEKNEYANDLEAYFYENKDGRTIHKWAHYLEVYDRHFSRFRGKQPTVLEIGVNYGGSLHMWRDYFGDDARIVGTDINTYCLQLQDEGFEIMLGDQADPEFWAEFKSKFPKFDIIIDDGGHTFEQQITTLKCLFDHVAEGGIYLCEDVHTSYQSDFGGGFRSANSFIEFSKGLIDEIHSWWSDESRFKVTQLTHSCKSIHFYDSIVVLEKGKKEPPYDVITGRESGIHDTYRKRKGGASDAEIRKCPPLGSSVDVAVADGLVPVVTRRKPSKVNRAAKRVLKKMKGEA